METLVNKLLYRPYKVMEFISLMESYGHPLSLHNGSKASDFFLTTSDVANEVKIIFGLPTINECAKQIILQKDPELLNKIEQGSSLYAKEFKNLSYRDICIEYFDFIYCNPWEIHTSLEIGEAQRFVLLLLEKYGYFNPDTLDPHNHVYHTVVSSMLSNLGYSVIKHKKFSGIDDVKVPVRYTKYDVCPIGIQGFIDAFIALEESRGQVLERPKEELYWRFDTSYKILGYI